MGPRLPLAPRLRDSVARLGRTMGGPRGAEGSETPEGSGEPPRSSGDPPALPRDHELSGKVGSGRGEQGWTLPALRGEGLGSLSVSGGTRRGLGRVPGAARFVRCCDRAQEAGKGKEAADPPSPSLPRGSPGAAGAGIGVFRVRGWRWRVPGGVPARQWQ